MLGHLLLLPIDRCHRHPVASSRAHVTLSLPVAKAAGGGDGGKEAVAHAWVPLAAAATTQLPLPVQLLEVAHLAALSPPVAGAVAPAGLGASCCCPLLLLHSLRAGDKAVRT